MNNIFVIQVLYGQPMPKLDKPVGIIYNDDKGYVMVFANTIEEAKSITNVDDSLFGIITIGDIAYEGYIVEKSVYEAEEYDDTPDYERYWEADGNPD